MYISEDREKTIRDDRASLIRTSKVYLVITMFLAYFGAVYERFGHGVYSYYMIYAFAFPLALGAFPALLLGTSKRNVRFPRRGRLLWNAGVATLTAGLLFKGVIEIYGTDSPFFAGYLVVGAALLIAGLVAGLSRGADT